MVLRSRILKILSTTQDRSCNRARGSPGLLTEVLSADTSTKQTQAELPPEAQRGDPERGGGHDEGQKELRFCEGVEEGEAEKAARADTGGGAEVGSGLLSHERESEAADTQSNL